MEQAPGNIDFSPEKLSDEKEDAKDKKKKNKSKRVGSFVPLVESAESSKPKTEKKEQSVSDKLLAELAFAQEKKEKQTAEKKPEKEPATNPEMETVDVIDVDGEKSPTAYEAREKSAEAFTTDYTKEIRANDLPPSKLFAEGIIDLGKPDEEIIALHDEQSSEQEELIDTPSVEMEEAEPSDLDGAAVAEVVEDDEAEDPTAPTSSSAAYSQAFPNAGQGSVTGTYSTRYNRPPAWTPPSPLSPNAQPSGPNTPPPPVGPNTPVSPFGPVPNPNQAPTAPNVVDPNQYVTRQELEDEVYYATKAGQRRGVLAGAIVAGGYEHFKHRRREKRQAKKMAAQERQFEKERKNNAFQLAEQTKKTNETERQVRELQTAEQRSRFTAQPETTPTLLTNTERATRPETQPKAAVAPEKANSFSGKLEKLVPKRPERVPKPDEVVTAERLDVPEGHRLETSAWHTIEVDAKTGKAVEKPTFAYGEEYYRERAKETRPLTDGQKQAAGEVALVAAAMQNGAGSTDNAQSANYPASASTQQRKTPTQILGSKAKSLLSSDKRKPSDKPSAAPLWPLVVGFIVIVVLIIIAL